MKNLKTRVKAQAKYRVEHHNPPGDIVSQIQPSRQDRNLAPLTKRRDEQLMTLFQRKRLNEPLSVSVVTSLAHCQTLGTET